MKNLIFILSLFALSAGAQDVTPITVNLSDNTVLQYGGAFVKQKCIVVDYRPIINQQKDYYLKVRIQYYQNNSGAYGSKITDLLNTQVGAISAGSISAAGTTGTNGTYTNVALTGGTGTGAILTVTIAGNVVTNITLTSSGLGYTVNDILTASPGNVVGFQCKVTGVALTQDQGQQILADYGDRYYEWQSTGKCVDASGNVTTCLYQVDGVTLQAGISTEAAYWQSFALNAVSGITALTNGAFDAIYKIIQAQVTKMNSRKNW